MAMGRSSMGKQIMKAPAKMKKVMTEFKFGKLHSGSKKGPVVKNRKQAIAIAISESKKGKSNVRRNKV